MTGGAAAQCSLFWQAELQRKSLVVDGLVAQRQALQDQLDVRFPDQQAVLRKHRAEAKERQRQAEAQARALSHSPPADFSCVISGCERPLSGADASPLPAVCSITLH